MSKYTPVEEVIRAWVIRGSHPGYHESQKNLLRENWPTLYNAIERLVLERGENKMKEYTPVEEVIRAWIVAGVNPEYHQAQKNLLRWKWPTLYNAIEQLAIEFVIKDEYVMDMKAEAWEEGKKYGLKRANREIPSQANPYRKETK